MKLKIISMFLLMVCSKNAFADIYDATYQKFSSLSNLWVQSPKLYKSSLESNLVEFSEAGVSVNGEVYKKWILDFVEYPDESNCKKLNTNFLWLDYKSEILLRYSHSLVDLDSTNAWIKIADCIGYVRTRMDDLQRNGVIGRKKEIYTGKIDHVAIGAIEFDGMDTKEALKRYTEEIRMYWRLSKIEQRLLKLIRAGFNNAKLTKKLSIEEYWSLQSNIVKRAKLTHKESKIAFGVQNGK